MDTTLSSPPPPFLTKTYDMVDDRLTDPIISWSQSCNSFVVWDFYEFSCAILPKFFKHNNFSSFVRQLNTYGFRKVDPDRWEFAHEEFVRGQKHRLNNIHRRKSTAARTNPSSTSSDMQASIVRAGGGSHHMAGLAEGELERLRREKNVMMLELGRLGSQHHSAQQAMRSISARLEATEIRQQQMMAFLARTMCSPAFLVQYVNNQGGADHNYVEQKLLEDQNGSISSGRKKRARLTNYPESWGESGATTGIATIDDHYNHHHHHHVEDHTSSCEINQDATGSITTSDEETTASRDQKLLILSLNKNIKSTMCLGNLMEGTSNHDSHNYHLRPDGNKEQGGGFNNASTTSTHDPRIKINPNEYFSPHPNDHFRMVDLNYPQNISDDWEYSLLPAESGSAIGQEGGPNKYMVSGNEPTSFEDLESELFWEHLLGPISTPHHDTGRGFVGCYGLNHT